MKKKDNTLLNARIKYFETLMADNSNIKESIEKAFNLYIKNNHFRQNNGNYYDDKLKMSLTPAIWAALYWELDDSRLGSQINPTDTLLNVPTPSTISGHTPKLF